MSYDDIPSHVPPAHDIPHYHGDSVRALLVVAALLIIVSLFMNGASPLGSVAAVAATIALVVAAGITNPAQLWMHWVDAVLAGLGAFFFGSSALGSYRAEGGIVDPTAFVFTLAIALISLVTLYLTTRTIRGMMLGEGR